MKINSIKLNNIGPYKELNTFDFNTTPDKNIILIGGKNGTGKTTLLKSIKIGLFGCFAFGYKTENNTYFNTIKNMLNSHSNLNDEFYIEIDFQFVENYKTNRYILKRSWKLDDNIEEFVLVKNQFGKELSDYQSLELLNKIRSLTSPSLINSFIYDGEKISSIIEQGQLEVYIKEIFNSIFNIDLLDQLNTDLYNYMIKSYKNSNKGIESDIALILNNINFIKSDLKAYETKFNDITKEISNIKININSKKKEFSTLGGLSKNEIENVENIILKAEKENERNNAFMREFIDDKLALSLMINELKAIIKQSRNELPGKYAEQLRVIQDYLNVDFSQYINSLISSSATIKFNINEEIIEKINNYIKELKEYKKQAFNILTTQDTLIESLKPFKEKLENSTTINKLDELANELEILQKKLINKTEELDKIVSTIKENENQLALLIKKYDTIAETIKKDKLANSSYIQCDNSLKLSHLFKQYVVENKLNKISQISCEIFNKTIRKENYVAKMIFSDNFEFKIYDSNEKKISPKQFSAGEMQILVSSIIWAMFKVSGRKEMFVFDTPLARLDRENRLHFINNIVSTISDQVIILSTDSEFIGENINAIQNRLKHQYLLNYNDNNKSTKIEDAYFGE